MRHELVERDFQQVDVLSEPERLRGLRMHLPDDADQCIRHANLRGAARKKSILFGRFEAGADTESVEEAFDNAPEFGLYDPLTGRWNYNPKTGEVRSPTFPEM